MKTMCENMAVRRHHCASQHHIKKGTTVRYVSQSFHIDAERNQFYTESEKNTLGEGEGEVDKLFNY